MAAAAASAALAGSKDHRGTPGELYPPKAHSSSRTLPDPRSTHAVPNLAAEAAVLPAITEQAISGPREIRTVASNAQAEAATPQLNGEQATTGTNHGDYTLTIQPPQTSRELSEGALTPQVAGPGSREVSREVTADAVASQGGMSAPQLPSVILDLPQMSVEAIAPQVVGELMAAFRNVVREELKGMMAPATFVPDLSGLPSARAHGPSIGSQSRPLPHSASMTDKRLSAFANGDPKEGTGVAVAGETQLAAPRINSSEMRMEIGMSTPLVDPSWSWGAREGYHLTPQYETIDESANQPASAQEEITEDTTFADRLKIAQDEMRGRKPEQSWLVTTVTRFLEDPESSRAAYIYGQFMTAFSVFAILVGMSPFVGISVPLIFEVIVDSILCSEILVRGLFCPDFSAFVGNYANLVDASSAAPLSVIFLMNAGLIEEELGTPFLLSSVPVIRLLRFSRRFPKMQILVTAFKDCLEALPVLLYTLAVMGCVFTSAIFMVEPRDNIPDLPESAWLVIATISTVGYGDITPCTKFGAALASILMVISQLYMAMPFGIIGYNFTIIWEKRTQIMLLNGTRDRLKKLGFGAREIPRLFELFDLDGSAEFDFQEFQLFFKELEIGFNEYDVVELFKLIDKDCGGTVDEREFVKVVYPEEYRVMYGMRQSVRHASKDGSEDGANEE